MPRHRAAWFGLVLDAYTRVCQLVGADLVAVERGPAWALELAARSAGHFDVARPSTVHRVTSTPRLAAAAVLRTAESLGAVTDEQTQLRAYGRLLGGDA